MARIYRIMRYGLVGGFVFALQFFLLAFLVEGDFLGPLWGSIAAFITALVSSFILQRYVTFRKTDREHMGRQFTHAVLLGLFNLCFNTLGMYALLFFGAHYLLAQLIVTAVIVVYTYVIYHYIFSVDL